jgi:hypothetical protein
VHRTVVIGVVAGGLAAVATTSGVAATPASSRACAHLITDPRGNARMWFLPTKPYNPDADLLYLDARTSKSTIELIVTMARVDTKPTTGTSVITYFTTDHQGSHGDWGVTVNHQIDGTTFELQNNNTQVVMRLSGSLNPATGTYTVQVPRAAIGATFRGALLQGLGVVVSQTVGADAANTGFIEQSTGPDHHYRVAYPYDCSRRS